MRRQHSLRPRRIQEDHAEDSPYSPPPPPKTTTKESPLLFFDHCSPRAERVLAARQMVVAEAVATVMQNYLPLQEGDLQ